MSTSLYQKVAQVLSDWSGEDDGTRHHAYEIGRDIVEMVIRDVKLNGFPAIDRAACHNAPETD